ncbi:MAG TPA: DEAD/DEAH box helicase family protein, partial [Thermoanaerobaculia bacterium]|nr:DEAD/DEAH box helicase family protein [Thermoanaerobaculia bacterium]
MKVSANFSFLVQEFPHVAESAAYAEWQVWGDPRASCFHARHALERLVARVYKVDKALSPPKVTNLDGYLHDPQFRELVPEAVWQKAEYVRLEANAAVHGKRAPAAETALAVVQELFHVAYWAGRTYLRKGAEQLQGLTFDASLVPKVAAVGTPVAVAELEAMAAARDAAEAAKRELESELERLRVEIAAIKAENAKVPETHDWDEAETRRRIIDLELARAGWKLDRARDCEVEVTGMPNPGGKGWADYVLWGDDGKPLGVVEAKKTMAEPDAGRQQAKLYADCLEAKHGQRPVIFYSNGYRTWLWDDTAYPPRRVEGFYTQDELATLVLRRSQKRQLDVADVKDAIVERYYQKRAIGSIAAQFAQGRRKALLVMATGTGKTRTSIALVDLLQRSGWVKRALFLADRLSLVNQTVAAFKAHLPESSPVNLVTEKDKTGRVYVSTYPTMMGLIDQSRDGAARFGPGHFDLVIIDEAHRSVYEKYRAIFRYFDALLVGLTATPREQVDKNTYDLFDLEPGHPTDAYELETAVRDEFLVPPKVQRVDLKFPREGIDYDSLSDEEKALWESLDWGDEAEEVGLPDRVDAAAINSWLFNRDTVDKVLQHLMEHGHKVESGDRLAKTILFARNHEHARFVEERFDHHYPEHKGHFARVIDHYAKYPQSLIDDFSQKDKAPHLAISVDMLDTGIDVPEVVNLVFFKLVRSKTKFWQMMGR